MSSCLSLLPKERQEVLNASGATCSYVVRVDKFLGSEVLKTRSMASQHCREGKVFVDGKP